MKIILTLLHLFILCAWVDAQVTITNASFPAAGDTLKTATDLSTPDIQITQAGGPFDWDFTSLNINFKQEIVYRPASAGSVADEVPNSNLVTINDQTETEVYYKVDNDRLSLIAVNGNDPIGAGIETIFRFTPPIIERRAPLTYQSSHTSSSNLLVAVAYSDLPPAVTDSLQLPIEPDSIRVRVTNEQNDDVDAYGTMTIPGGSYEVLREKRTVFRETRVDILVPLLGWQDVTDLLISNAPFEGLGKDTLITYNFLSNEAKEPIAVATMDNNETTVTSVTFKDNGVLSGTGFVADPATKVRVMPNPVRDQVELEFEGLNAGQYDMKFYTIQGRLLHTKKLKVDHNLRTGADLTHLPSGCYFYHLSNAGGQIVATGKLVKH